MRLVSYVDGAGRPSWGALDDASLIVDVNAELGGRHPSVRALLAADAVDEARHVVASVAGELALHDVTLLPPVVDPARVLCAGVNYEEHRLETGRDPSASPTIFTR